MDRFYNVSNFPNEFTKIYNYQKSLKTDLIVIDSFDRDRTLYPDPSNYSINFLNSSIGKVFKNVKSIRLLTGSFPDQNDIQKEPYLLLEIKEIDNDALNGSNSNIQRSTSIIQLDRPILTGFFFNMKTDICKSLYKTFDPPINLSKLSIKIKKKDGSLFSFGTDTDPTPNPLLQHMLTFEVISENKQYDINLQSLNGSA